MRNEIQQAPNNSAMAGSQASQSFPTPTGRVERKAVLKAMWDARGQFARVKLAENLSLEENRMLLECLAEDAAEKAR